jgi:hypothetical protein
MALVHPQSLAATLDAVNEALFFRYALASAEIADAAQWIAGRQGLPGSYAGMFAPTAEDLTSGIRVFTGEAVRTGGGMRHVLGEEACRALILLGGGMSAARSALERATAGMLERLAASDARASSIAGTYCCGVCSAALWRHLAAGGLADQERRLAAAMLALKGHRLGDGRWRRFPFYYTLLSLTEVGSPAAREEIRYAARACERASKRGAQDKFGDRRKALVELAMTMCS